MEDKFKFVITAESEDFENNYIKKYSCACGGKYQILLRDRLEEDITIYNLIKAICLKCSKPADFLFDITEREKERKKDREQNGEVQERKRTSRRRRERRASASLLGVAKDISDAFISFGDSSDRELEEMMKSLTEDSLQDPEARKNIVSLKDYEHLKFLYAQAMTKIRYLEEEKTPILEAELRESKKENRLMKEKIDKLNEELQEKTTRIEDLEDLVIEKEEDARIYQKELEKERKEFQEKLNIASASGWRKFLGGK